MEKYEEKLYEPEEQIKILAECIRQTELKNTIVSAVLEEVRMEDHSIKNRIEINKHVSQKPSVHIEVTQKYSYVTLVYDLEKDRELLTIRNYFDLFIKKTSELFLQTDNQSKSNSLYMFTLSLVHEDVEKGMSYSLMLIDPVFAAKEGNKLMFCFETENTSFAVEGIDYYGIEQELQYDEAKHQKEIELANKKQKMDEETLEELRMDDYTGYDTGAEDD